MISDTLTVVAPLSLESWYSQFAGSQNDVVFIGEESSKVLELADNITKIAGGREVRVLSGHDSLLRDWALSEELRTRNIIVSSQSGMATAAGVDKLLQKQLLQLAGVPVPSWGFSDVEPPACDRVLRKGRASTQSRGLEWRNPGTDQGSDEYWESYVDGIEYSVVLYRDKFRTVFFPPVWKGSVSKDLTPPWRRLRLVPAGIDTHLSSELLETSLRITNLLDIWGFAEVEFIAPAHGPAVVIDINPRVCGTMRIVAMATGIPIFDPSQFPPSQNLPLMVHKWAAELPYNGTPFASPRVVATSRLTCIGDSPADVKQLLADQVPELADTLWPKEWLDNKL